jgi:hypothetical protein
MSKMRSCNLILKVNLMDRRTGQALEAKVKDSEVCSEHITGAKLEKK